MGDVGLKSKEKHVTKCHRVRKHQLTARALGVSVLTRSINQNVRRPSSKLQAMSIDINRGQVDLQDIWQIQ